MKYLIITFFLALIIPMNLLSQRGQAASRMEAKRQEAQSLKYYNLIFGADDKDFEISESPKEYKEDAVVILSQKIHISFLRNTRANNTTGPSLRTPFMPGNQTNVRTSRNQTKGIIRKRVLIQDKSAIDEFSEFYYQTSDAIGIEVIKPSGEKNKIDLSKSVKIETDVPDFYADSYHSADYKKIAIPNLEVGDILDYFKVFKEDYSSNIELIAPIASNYPIVKQEIIFDVDKLWNFNYNTFNSDVSFQRDPEGGIDINGRKRKLIKRFILKGENWDAIKSERWDYENRTEPILKIKAAPPGQQRDEVSKKLDVKKVIIQDFAAANQSRHQIKDGVKARLKSLDLKKKPKKEIIDILYHVIRYQFLSTNFVANVSVTGFFKFSVEQTDFNEYFKMKSYFFAAIFADFLDDYDIESEFLVTTPRSFGDIENVVTYGELEYGIYIPMTQKYYWSVDNYKSSGDFPSNIFGASGYKFSKMDLRKRDGELSKITIPYSNPEDNKTLTNLDVEIKNDNSLKIKKAVEYKGVYKSFYSPLLLADTEILEEDMKEIFSERDYKRWQEAKRRHANPDFEKQQEEKLDKKKENIKDWLNEDFEIENLDNYSITSSGRSLKGDNLKANFEFSAKNYINKAGPNLIFDIGKLIGEQVELSEDEINDRTKNVELGFARILTNEIKITLPEDLQARGLDNLNSEIDNEVAAFKSEARQEGNTLFVKTIKTYKQQTIPLTEWSKLTEMLEVAYKFTQQKVILKK